MGDSSGISDRGTKAKSITSCDNAFVTNILLLLSLRFRTKKPSAAATLHSRFRAKDICCPKRLIGRPQEALLCAKAKRQQQMFYLCESEASATKRPAVTEINHTLW
ncbi:hypothetical protein [Lysinibacillus xylanilyticus]|uniref:hypothetical protein n=1 Tax=Lysinibacillus xylanilyticus TaxID=582475 RepID=UPI002B24F482|nr:hypothetical protein [Lysinibacillus xylanilyticus]